MAIRALDPNAHWLATRHFVNAVVEHDAHEFLTSVQAGKLPAIAHFQFGRAGLETTQRLSDAHPEWLAA